MQYLRMYTDADGETHFEEVDITFREVDFSPPTPPVQSSAFMPAAQVGVVMVTPGWYGDWHPVPQRQLVMLLAGELEVETSDGQRRSMRPGGVSLTEDTTGKGHRTRVVSPEPAVLLVVALPAGSSNL